MLLKESMKNGLSLNQHNAISNILLHVIISYGKNDYA